MTSQSQSQAGEGEVSCGKCEAKFTRQSALRKHLVSRHPPDKDKLAEDEDRDDDNNNASGVSMVQEQQQQLFSANKESSEALANIGMDGESA